MSPLEQIKWLINKFVELGCSHNLAEFIVMMDDLEDKIAESLNAPMLIQYTRERFDEGITESNFFDYAYAARLITNAERKFGKELIEKIVFNYEEPNTLDTGAQQWAGPTM